MNKNTRTNEQIKLDIKKVDQSVYLPKILSNRIIKRIQTKRLSIFFFIYNILLIVLGIIYIEASSDARNFIVNGDEFWEFVFEFNLRPKEISLICAFTGMLITVSSAFNIINGGVILKHIFRGGLKIRLTLSSYASLTLQILNFCFSFFIIVRYRLSLYLNVFYIGITICNVIITGVMFHLIKNLVEIESDYLLPLEMLMKHKLDFKNMRLPENVETPSPHHSTKTRVSGVRNITKIHPHLTVYFCEITNH